MKHTTGEWHFNDRQPYGQQQVYSLQTGQTIALCYTSGGVGGISEEEAKHNAALIASAPDLLEALQAMVNEFTLPDYEINCDHSVGICCCNTLGIISKAKAAINKATNL